MVCGSQKYYPKFVKFVICNLSQSCQSSTVLVLLWFIISLMFFYLSELNLSVVKITQNTVAEILK